MSDATLPDKPNAPAPGHSPGDLLDAHPGAGGAANPDFLMTEALPLPTTSFRDMDNDGDLDIVVTQRGTQSYWLENTIGPRADAIFNQSIFSRITPTTMTVGDVDGDSTPDLVIGHLSGAKIFHDDGAWSMKSLSIVLDTPHTILLEDLNQDGDTDIIIRDNRELVVFPGCMGEFGAQVMTWPDLGSTPLVGVGDIDVSNTTLEILTLNANTGTLGIISHNGFSWQGIRTVSTVQVSSFTVADLNNDGVDDIYIEDEDGNQVWLESDGSGSVLLHNSEPVISDATQEEETTADATESESAKLSSSLHSISKSLSFSQFYQTATESIEEPQFDYTADPDLTHESDQSTTADFSSNNGASMINLLSGTACQATSGGWNDWTHWTGTDDVVDAIGSPQNDAIFGSQSANHIAALGGNDWIFAGDGNDTLVGGQGVDILYGDNDDDLLSGQQGSDVLSGGHGQDTMYGGQGDDILFGNDGDDIILGGDGAEYMYGGNGDDILHGGDGADIMMGDAGSDTFHYVSADEGGDTIFDFNVVEDSFEFEFGSHTLYVTSEPYSGDLGIEGDAFIWEDDGSGSGKLYYDADTSISGDETLIAEVDLTDPEETLTVDHINIV